MAQRRKARYDPPQSYPLFELMNLFRLIIIVLAVWIAYRLWLNFRAKAKTIAPKPKSPKAIPDMVECTVCQMHIPENEALRKGDKIYCSRQHLESDN